MAKKVPMKTQKKQAARTAANTAPGAAYSGAGVQKNAAQYNPDMSKEVAARAAQNALDGQRTGNLKGY